ncbi:MAG TPA: sugar phosphate isomerase/epimerase [Vicinamibacterales bacterium]|nr:sugar phosphate isomerase/epimerase [Vicinamibacterales bacterium]
MPYTRREFGQIALACLPASVAFARMSPLAQSPIPSRFGGVQVGVITYSFRSMPAEDILKALVQIGIGEVELMSNHAEGLAGAPAGRGRGRNPELATWRTSVTPETFRTVRRKFDSAGIELRLLCYNMSRNITDEQIEYGFQMARALGVKAISTSTQVSVAKRVAPFAEKHQLIVAYHNHSNVTNPDEVATPESFAAVTSYSKFHGINLDVGHFTAANFDPLAFIEANHARITNLHLKDMKRNQGPYTPWGQGDAPLVQVLRLLKGKQYDIAANIEYEYGGEDPVVEVAKCFQFCKDALK